MKKLDFHVHILNDIPVEKTVKNYTDMCLRKGYDGVCIQALIHECGEYLPDANEKALEIKEKMPGSFAFGAINRKLPCFAEQAERLMKQGFDGIKLLGGKPTEYRQFGYGYEDACYGELFGYAEKHGIPILAHNADPKVNWDISNASARAIEKGWVYDESVPNKEFFLKEIENVLEKHPKLKLAIAHLGFYSNDLSRADRLLDRYSGLMFDITPALVIYSQLSENGEKAKAFFEKHHTRLIYGTDADNDLVGEARAYNDVKTEVVSYFLEKKEAATVCGYKLSPVGLDAEKLENIYYNNAMRFMGKI